MYSIERYIKQFIFLGRVFEFKGEIDLRNILLFYYIVMIVYSEEVEGEGYNALRDLKFM